LYEKQFGCEPTPIFYEETQIRKGDKGKR